MSHRPDQLADDAITQFLRVRSADPELGLLDEIVRTVGATPQDREWVGLRPILLPRRIVLIAAIALLVAALGAVAVGSGLLRPDPSVERMNVIGDTVAAINSRDVAALKSNFAVGGTVEFPGIDARSGSEGDVYLHDQPVDNDERTEGWMGILGSWGMEAQLGSCRVQSESTVSCAVRTRWHVLQVEIGEEWTFDFDGASLTRLDMMARVDPDPTDRLLPLGLADLEGWEAWLSETHPEQAARLLPTGPDLSAHYYFRFGLDAEPAEIGASIREYVRAELLGPQPASADRMTVVREQVDAINARDADAFTETFLPEGVFAPGGDFRTSSSLFGNSLPLADAPEVEAWMAINRAWGFEAEIIACNQDPGAPITAGYGSGAGDPMMVRCEVAARWAGLSLEITQVWSYEFHGPGVGHWESSLLDLNPRERELPLGYDGLLAWEAWLATADPASAARFLNPRISEPPGCDGCAEWWEMQAPGDPERAARLAPLRWSAENDWSIQGRTFSPHGLIPYDPQFADEIERSINDYLAEVQS